ncbi:hypothetical protein SRHO_G00222810 [Serrasalmus rhombeus]
MRLFDLKILILSKNKPVLCLKDSTMYLATYTSLECSRAAPNRPHLALPRQVDGFISGMSSLLPMTCQKIPGQSEQVMEDVCSGAQ